MRPRRDALDISGADEVERQGAALVEDGQGAVEALMDLDVGPGVAAPVGTGEDLHAAWAEGHRIIGCDGPAVLEAEDRLGIQVGRPGAEGRRGLGGVLGEARVEALQEVRQERLGAVDGVDAGQAHLRDEAILQGLEEPLDAAFGLGRGGGDPGDAELVEGATHLRGGAPSLQLFLQRGRATAVALEDLVLVGVDRDGQAVRTREGAQEEQVALGVLPFPEDGAEDPAGGIIDGGEQDHLRAALLEPGMVAAVKLHEQARLRHARAALAVPGRTAAPRAAEAGRAEDPAQSGAGERQRLALGQEFGEVEVVHLGVGGLGEGDDALTERGIQAARRGATAVPMDERPGSTKPVRPTEPAHLADREVEESGGLDHAHLATLHGVQDDQLLLGS